MLRFTQSIHAFMFLTGSARPLAWAHAEYIKLLCLLLGCFSYRIKVVEDRYLN